MSDQELLKLLLEQPEYGCQQLLSEYTGLVLAICRKKLGGCCTAEDIEELASDILFEFYRKRAQISLTRGSIRSLLAVLAGRRCIDYYRAHSSGIHAMQAEDIDEKANTLPDPAMNPEETVLSAEQRRLVLEAIASLGEPDHETIMSKYYYGETAAEIAGRLSMRTGTVEMRISRAKQKLKALLRGGAGK